MAVGSARGESSQEFVMYVDSESIANGKDGRQTRRAAYVVGFLCVAMMAAVAVVSIQPSRVEMASTSLHASSPDAVLEAELIKAAPHSSVDSMLKQLSTWRSHVISSGDDSQQMLSSYAIGSSITSDLADTSKLCPNKDVILEKFNQLIAKLSAESVARNATDNAAQDDSTKSLQAWLDAEALYRLTTEKAKEADEGAQYARAQYEKWAATLKQTQERSDKMAKDYAAERLTISTERDLILEVMRLIGVLQSEPAATKASKGSSVLLKELNDKVFELKQKAMSTGGIELASVEKLSSALADSSEMGIVKSILEDLLKDLQQREDVLAATEAKTAQELRDHKDKVIKYETDVVDLSNAADKAKQQADSADLKRQELNGAKKNAVEAYQDEHAAYKIISPPGEREIAIIQIIVAKINAFCTVAATPAPVAK